MNRLFLFFAFVLLLGASACRTETDELEPTLESLDPAVVSLQDSLAARVAPGMFMAVVRTAPEDTIYQEILQGTLQRTREADDEAVTDRYLLQDGDRRVNLIVEVPVVDVSVEERLPAATYLQGSSLPHTRVLYFDDAGRHASTTGQLTLAHEGDGLAGRFFYALTAAETPNVSHVLVGVFRDAGASMAADTTVAAP